MSATMFQVKKTTELPEVLDSNSIALPVSRTDGKKGKSGLCIVVPATSEAILNLIQIDPFGKSWLLKQIDDLRSRLASTANKAGCVITSETIGITAILAEIKKQALQSTLSAESVGQWFDDFLAVPLLAAFKTKKPGAIEVQLVKLVKLYRDMFCSLAGKQVVMQESSKIQLATALELLEEGSEGADHPTTCQLAEKISSLESPEFLL